MSYRFSFLVPWMLTLLLVQRLAKAWLGAGANRAWPRHLALGLASAVIVLLPVRGIPLGRWMAGLNLAPSIPLLCLLTSLVWKTPAGRDWFQPQDRLAAGLFGGLTGTFLYPLAMGLGNFDPYRWGWSFSPLLPVIALASIFLIWRQNRFGIILLLSILGWDLQCLESTNLWDYLVDPLYWVFSLLMLAQAALQTFRQQKMTPALEKARPIANPN